MAVLGILNGAVTYNKAKFKPHDRQKVRVAKVTHNCEANSLTAGNAIAMIPIPIGAVVLSASLTVDTVEDSAAVISLGVAEDGTTFVSGANAQTASLVSPSLVCGYPFSAAGNIYLSADNACDTLVVTVTAVYVETDAQTAIN
jgi:hypothetical protein